VFEASNQRRLLGMIVIFLPPFLFIQLIDFLRISHEEIEVIPGMKAAR
jgi:hypothetical protein